MKRREFIAGLGGAVEWPLAVRAQRSATPVIGWLDQVARNAMPDPFRRGLAEMGFAEGRKVSVEYHSGSRQQLPALAADLVLRRPAVIVAGSGGSAVDARSATQTIPIVFIAGNDPVELGLDRNLNRPTSNLTGISVFGDEIVAKRLELLHELVPAAKSIALLTGAPGPTGALGPSGQSEARQIQVAGRALGLHVLANASAPKDLASAFATLVQQRADALVVGASVTLNAARGQIIALAARHAIPTIFFYSYAVSEGGLSSYGPDIKEAEHQAGIYTGRILNGEKPADLPIIRPTKFVFAINLKTAKALGLTIPPSLLALADEVIE
jgi:putative tryptophan/tyrosine transport system substrate-binding protein